MHDMKYRRATQVDKYRDPTIAPQASTEQSVNRAINYLTRQVNERRSSASAIVSSVAAA
jgi:hypothetical protein